MRKKEKPQKKTKSAKQLYLPPVRLKPENPNLLKLSVSKLAMLKNPQTKLCKAVLINNAFKELQKPFWFGWQGLSWQACAGYQESIKSESIGDSSEVVEEDEDESEEVEQALDIHVSPYSYNSFLSEVYTAVNNKFMRKLS
eukprot:TRINITY_DN25423_c0_g1_i1.p1 TRINITY_DN25423_c0_g1~~TRINITY_DN25423_c0_g1_i1.p1  ORF type:complete len:141 (+),score=36.85 TRINITY_DN25423_c0_g1_i1:29-451(+)